jgi:hypothetical protein
MDRQAHGLEQLGIEAEFAAEELDFGTELGAPERCVDPEIARSSVVAQVLDCKRKAVQVNTVECLQRGKG